MSVLVSAISRSDSDRLFRSRAGRRHIVYRSFDWGWIVSVGGTLLLTEADTVSVLEEGAKLFAFLFEGPNALGDCAVID